MKSGSQFVRLAVPVAALLSCCSVVSAQTVLDQVVDKLAGTIGVNFSPVFSGGQLTGCTMEFNSLGRDWTYRQGSPTRFSGSFGFRVSGPNAVGVVLKVVLTDLEPTSLQPRPTNPPKRSYLQSGIKTNLSDFVSSYNSDTPGGLFSIFKLGEAAAMIIEALDEGKITIRYARTQQGLDAPINIDLRVIDIDNAGSRNKSDSEIMKMFQCIPQLIK